MTQTEFMKTLANSYSIYQAAKWLSKAREELGNKTPAELLKVHKVDKIHELLLADLNKKNEK